MEISIGLVFEGIITEDGAYSDVVLPFPLIRLMAILNARDWRTSWLARRSMS